MEVIELGPANVQSNGSAPIPETKVSTDLFLNQLMKQNEILMNLLPLQNNNANAEPKVIPVTRFKQNNS